MGRIAPVLADPEHEIAVVATSPQERELRDDELTVGVDLEDPLGARALEAAHDRRPVAGVHGGALDVKPRPILASRARIAGVSSVDASSTTITCSSSKSGVSTLPRSSTSVSIAPSSL